MVIKTPQFSDFRILRREMLESLSDYAFSFGQLLYEGYADGILSGCRLVTTESEIQVRPGIIVLGGKLYLINEPLSVPYYPTDTLCICKFRFMDEYRADNFVYRDLELVLTAETEHNQGDIELCRFKLQKEALLRYEYVDFKDRNTEYDTLNTIYAPFSCYGESSLSPDILQAYCRELISATSDSIVDQVFCIQVNAERKAVAKEAVAIYIVARTGDLPRNSSNEAVYESLFQILDNVKQGIDPKKMNSKSKSWKIDLE